MSGRTAITRVTAGLSSRTRATLAGVFILTAYLMLIAEATDSAAVVFLVDAVSGLSVIGIAVLLYPMFRPSSLIASGIYLGARVLEGAIMIAAGTLFLAGQTGVRSDLYEHVHIYCFIIGAAFLYYLLYQTALVPRFIAIWGFVAVGFLVLTTVLSWFDYGSAWLDATLVLMIGNEVFLAVWLMARGFTATALVPDDAPW